MVATSLLLADISIVSNLLLLQIMMQYSYIDIHFACVEVYPSDKFQEVELLAKGNLVVVFLIKNFFLIFSHVSWLAGSQFPDQGSNSYP